MRIVGYKKADFIAKDGTSVTGYNVYVSREIDPNKGRGVEIERCYLSDSKLTRAKINLDEIYGKEIKIYYNKYGKIDSIVIDE